MNCFLTTVLLLSTSIAASAQMSDFKGHKDPALFTRMPHYFLPAEDSVTDKAFDAFEFQLKEGTQSVEGHHLNYSYAFDEAAGNMPGMLQIVRNYEAAARKIGGQVLWDDVRRATIKIAKNGQETWAFLEAFNEGRSYELHIVERQQMKQDVVADAGALQSGLKESGHVEVPGIFFDFGKAEIKAESEAALNEVVKLLQGNAAWKVWVVGHTDNVGTVESNLDAIRRAIRRGGQGAYAEGHRCETDGPAWRRPVRSGGEQRERRGTGAESPGGTGERRRQRELNRHQKAIACPTRPSAWRAGSRWRD